MSEYSCQTRKPDLKLKAEQRNGWIQLSERMDEHHMVRRVFMAEVSEGQVRGWLRLGRMDGMKVAWVTK